MASLFGRAPKDSFQELLKLDNTGAGLDTTLRAVQDGSATNSPLQLSTTQIALNGALWPTTLGTAGQVLTAGANGTMTWVTATSYAPLSSPDFSGTPSAPTPTQATNNTTIATTEFVHAAVNALPVVSAFNSRTGTVTLQSSDISGALGFTPANSSTVTSTYAPLASPVLTGNPTAPTPTVGDNDTSIATTAFVNTAVTGRMQYAGSWNPVTNSPSLSSGTGVTGALYQIGTSANTALVIALAGTQNNPNNGSNNPQNTYTLTSVTGLTVGMAVLYGSSYYGKITAINTDTNVITTNIGEFYSSISGNMNFYPMYLDGLTSFNAGDYVFFNGSTWQRINGQDSSAEVVSFNGRGGIVTLTSSDVTSSLGFTPANVVSPALTGNPTAPTRTSGDNSTNIATTAFVASALTANVVTSFNTRQGAITLTGPDITNAGGALLASPTLTGTPTAPTPTLGDNSTKLATTAFVGSAIAAAGVSSFNTRTGAITLTSSDVTTALTYTPVNPATAALTGTPTAPTATVGTNTTQIASTAFVTTAVNGVTGGKYSFNTTVTNTFSIAVGSMYTAIAAGFTGTLPALSGTTAATYATVVNSASGGNITIAATGSDKLGGYFGPTGVASMTLQPGESATFVALPSSTIWEVINYTKIDVTAFNNRTGAVTLLASDISTAQGFTSANTTLVAPLASPTFTGVPAAPTATAGTNTTQLATTAFVTAGLTAKAIANLLDVTLASPSNGQVLTYNGTNWVNQNSATGISSFNTRTGAITLSNSDVTTALGFTPATSASVTALAPLASPALTGTPTAPTPTTSDNSTTIATTAFVKNQAAVSSGLKQIMSSFPGNISPFTGQLRWYPSASITLVQISLFIATAPSGSSITVDLKKNGVSVFGGSKPSIASGSNTSGAVSIPGTITLTTSDYLTIDISSGSSGADMTARVDYQ
jgi:hypothetical protein